MFFRIYLMTGCQVRRLRTENGPQGLVCRGVEFVGGGSAWFAESACETILAAGAIGSPQILQRSDRSQDSANLEYHVSRCRWKNSANHCIHFLLLLPACAIYA